jgi:hypothetical protein
VQLIRRISCILPREHIPAAAAAAAAIPVQVRRRRGRGSSPLSASGLWGRLDIPNMSPRGAGELPGRGGGLCRRRRRDSAIAP